MARRAGSAGRGFRMSIRTRAAGTTGPTATEAAMNVSDNDDHVIDAIEAYLAGGLSPAERARFEMHVAACATCAALLDEAARSDAAVRELFADQRPGDDF